MITSFIQLYFNESVNLIAEDQIRAYFSDERDESLTLEFKSYNPKEKPNFDGVLRTIAAFLNSEGGLLVFGAPPEIRKEGNYRVVQGNPTPLPSAITTKDSLVRMIADNISYMPVGVRIEAIAMQEGGFVYLIEVQEGLNKPYQYDKRYFIRLDGQSRPAPHYLVEALFKQVKAPELKGYLRITSYRFDTNKSTYDRNTIRLEFQVSIFNETKNLNDSGVYVQIIATAGRFVPHSQENYIFNHSLVLIKDASPIITYALPTKCTFDYEIGSDEYIPFFRDGQELEVAVVFGSNKSVTRRSDYYISFKEVQITPIMNQTFTQALDLNSLLIIRKEENISMYDVWKGTEEGRRESLLNGI